MFYTVLIDFNDNAINYIIALLRRCVASRRCFANCIVNMNRRRIIEYSFVVLLIRSSLLLWLLLLVENGNAEASDKHNKSFHRHHPSRVFSVRYSFNLKSQQQCVRQVTESDNDSLGGVNSTFFLYKFLIFNNKVLIEAE